MDVSDHIKGILGTLPDKPGCYIMKDKAGTIIYVGKAVNLKNRVRSYFQMRLRARAKVDRPSVSFTAYTRIKIYPSHNVCAAESLLFLKRETHPLASLQSLQRCQQSNHIRRSRTHLLTFLRAETRRQRDSARSPYPCFLILTLPPV